MSITRRQFTALGLGALAWPSAAFADDTALKDALFYQVYGATSDSARGLALIKERGNPDMAAGLIRAMRYIDTRRVEIGETLTAITGANHGSSWFDWMLWLEQNPQIIPHPAHIDLTRSLMLRIDPNFDDFLDLAYLSPEQTHIRLEEVVWGGVRKDGIPSLDNPTMLSIADAGYLVDDDLVFGVEINGDLRAYPLRVMGWHEMFNDVIGGVPVALAYCTLCGSGILFETNVAGRSTPLVFGSSGFLYRSNKLMFDRQTNSLWNQFTGKPVIGSLASSGITLKQRPVVITTWGAWKQSHPSTKVLSPNTGHKRDYGSGVVYQQYFASPDLMFPAQVDQRQHRQKDYVFAVRQFGAARAWPLDAFSRVKAINDAIADTNLFLVGDADTRSVRAYERGNLTFSLTSTGAQASDGSNWQITEDALVGPDNQRLPRVAGHIAYWFAWDNYLGDAATVYQG